VWQRVGCRRKRDSGTAGPRCKREGLPLAASTRASSCVQAARQAPAASPRPDELFEGLPAPQRAPAAVARVAGRPRQLLRSVLVRPAGFNTWRSAGRGRLGWRIWFRSRPQSRQMAMLELAQVVLCPWQSPCSAIAAQQQPQPTRQRLERLQQAARAALPRVAGHAAPAGGRAQQRLLCPPAAHRPAAGAKPPKGGGQGPSAAATAGRGEARQGLYWRSSAAAAAAAAPHLSRVISNSMWSRARR
jgi:hypothetical protein